MPKNVPIQANEANYLAGADLYKQHCAVCHGLPLAPKSAIATGMYPHPPLLFEGKGVTDDEPGESYWKILNGIRLSGMPGFSKSLSETQMWQMALLVANADKLPPSVKTALVAPIGVSTPAASTPPGTSAFRSYRRDNEKFGRVRVVNDLKAKGVHGDVIEKAVSSVYDDVKEENLARDYLRRKRLQKPKDRDQKQTARIFRQLMRAGFGSKTIFTILKKWDVDEETLTELET